MEKRRHPKLYNVFLSLTQHKLLKLKAAAEGTTAAVIVRRALERELAGKDQRDEG